MTRPPTVAGASHRCFVLTCPNMPEGLHWYCPAHEASIRAAAARDATRAIVQQAQQRGLSVVVAADGQNITVGTPRSPACVLGNVVGSGGRPIEGTSGP